MKNRLHWYIYRAIGALLKLNTRVYGVDASRELLRDLNGETYYEPKTEGRK